MSASDSKAIARRFFEAFDRNDWRAIGALVTPDYILHLAATTMDFEGHKQFGAMFQTAFPNCAHRIDDQIAEADRVVTRLTVHGTQTGEMMGVPASNKAIAMTGIQILRIRNSKIAEEWTEFDQLGMLQQIGALPAPTQPEPAAALAS